MFSNWRNTVFSIWRENIILKRLHTSQIIPKSREKIKIVQKLNEFHNWHGEF